MDLQNIDWNLIRSFLAVAETGSLSGAARAIGQSQPTLGRHVKELEAALGANLYTRHTRGFELTETGQAMLPHAMTMRDAMQSLELTAAGHSIAERGTVRITASVFASQYLLPDILADVRAEASDIQIELVPSDATENLLFREADLAVRMYRPTQLDIITRHITDLSIGTFAAKSYLDRKGRPASLDDLFDHDLVGFDRDDTMLRAMANMGWSATRDWFAVRCDNQAVYWALVRAGCGIGFTQTGIARSDPFVEELSLGIDIPSLPVWLAAPDLLRHTPRVRRVWDLLSDRLRDCE